MTTAETSEAEGLLAVIARLGLSIRQLEDAVSTQQAEINALRAALERTETHTAFQRSEHDAGGGQ